MNVHKNAPLTPKGREAMARSVVEGGLSQADAAYQFNTTPKTVAKWVKRFRAEGVELWSLKRLSWLDRVADGRSRFYPTVRPMPVILV